jgi:very-short-patch-repair endonuclease
MAAGEQAFASHGTAVRLYELDLRLGHSPIELSAPARRKIRLNGVRSHRLGTLLDGDVRTIDGIRCAAPIRLVLDLSGRLTPEELGRLIDELMRKRLMEIEQLRTRVDETRSAPGRSVRKLRVALAQRLPGYDPGESTLEARIMRVIRKHGFPDPVQQFDVAGPAGRFRLDFAYPEALVYLEGNGFGFHSMASDIDRDALRQNMLVGGGWRPLTFTWRMKDAQIVEALDALFDRRTMTWRPPPTHRLVSPASGGARR